MILYDETSPDKMHIVSDIRVLEMLIKTYPTIAKQIINKEL